MIVWMLSSVAASILLAAAARVAEPALRGRGLAVRWVWAATLVGAVALPARAWLAPAPTPVADSMAAPVSAEALTALDRAVAAAPSVAVRIEPVLPALWTAASLLTALVLLGGLARLGLRARRWPRAELSGLSVLVSERFGPAVLGIVRPRIVVPRWVLELDPARRCMVLLHEEEHRRAGDAALLALGGLAVVATPWNPVCWWLLHRLRGAVEMDCDARVLARGVDVPAYGRLLLDLGTRVGDATLAVAAFAKPRSLLERRLTTMVRGERGTRTRGALALLVGVALVAVACETPVGMALPGESGQSEAETGTLKERPAGAMDDFAVVADGQAVRDERRPVIYVDGVRLQGPDAGLPNPVDIARVEVLKGDAAERKVGPEGRNGVIYVYTRSSDDERATISVESAAPVTLRPVSVVTIPAPAGVSAGTIRERPGGEYRFDPK